MNPSSLIHDDDARAVEHSGANSGLLRRKVLSRVVDARVNRDLRADASTQGLGGRDRCGDSGVELMLSAGESGQVGVFAEQLDNWRFIKATLLAADSAGWSGGPPVRGPATTEDPSVVTSQDAAAVLRVLNGFAYTGGSTLAAARAVPGRVQVTHLDGSKSSVDTARQNAAALDLPASGVRWMTEDCLTFVQREVKRGSKYEALIFDPPAFGRGGRAKGSKVWKLDTGSQSQ